MSALDAYADYSVEIEKIMQDAGLGDRFQAQVQKCSDMGQVFAALATEGAQHVALLSKTSEPIQNMFDYIKACFESNKSVVLALFSEKATQ